ncbi:MAG: ATP-binding cassette domain-containing protein [Sutterellaceae bacterium]|nr:ATP-binding cassette domain-containing protein [Burkholderiaceae bacterium]MDW8430924.1 ATP-binding cassette domain-containing protein [Sutterellaceae bacterium]
MRIEAVCKRFGASTVLDGIDLAVGAGELVCLLGPSGCGKTTLLRIICGLERPDAGRIWLNGQDITAWPPARRRFGMVFQSYALFPNLTALGNVAYGLGGMDRRFRERRARDMLELVGLAAHASKYPAQLSGGQQQRVALARALAPQPSLLLLDEPLSALDAQVRSLLRDEIRAIQRRLRVSAIMVTHDQEEALAIADRVVLMHRGRIEQQDTPRGLYLRPATPFAARFVGRVNLLRGMRLSDGTLRIGQVALVAPGDAAPPGPVRIAVRPSHLRLLPPGEDSARHALAAWVIDEAFHGPWTSLRLRVPALGEGATLEVELATPAHGALPWRPGSPCRVELPPAALRVIADHDGDDACATI